METITPKEWRDFFERRPSVYNLSKREKNKFFPPGSTDEEIRKYLQLYLKDRMTNDVTKKIHDIVNEARINGNKVVWEFSLIYNRNIPKELNQF